MAKVEDSWVREQLTNAKTKRAVGTAILKLLDTWNEIVVSEENAKDVIERFRKLALGHAIAEEKIDDLRGTWIQAQPGQLKVTDIIRVKTDVFNGDLGKMHNGRVGKVVGVRYGDIVVKTIDNRQPSLDGSHYSPHMLEKLVP
jgi:hypothetical protein